MLQVARLAPKLLGDATGRVAEFLNGQWTDDGGGRDRAGRSDLYYTVFAAEGLHALQLEPDYAALERYLDTFGDGADLDLVHLSCLARCWSITRSDVDATRRAVMLERLRAHRAEDGGYAPTVGQAEGTLYHTFLVVAAQQDLRAQLDDPGPLVDRILRLRCDDGSFTNERRVPVGNVPSTSAAIALLRQLGAEVPGGAAEWLLNRHRPEGGFDALPGAPMPDLLSTATALHALTSLHVDLDPVREATLDFLDTLWTGKAFCGSWGDDLVDSEYTFYALLSLGHLA